MKKNLFLKGFTLLEAVIAVFILTIGIIGVFQAFPLSIQTEKTAKMDTIAAQLAQEKIEEILSKSFNEISSEATTTLNIPFQAFSRSVEVSCYDPNGSLPPNCPDTGIKKITVTVLWKSFLGISEKKFKISTFFSKR